MNDKINQTQTVLPHNPTVYKHIVKATANGLKPRKKRYYCRDTKLEGFFIVINPNGTKSYVVRAKLNKGKHGKFITIGSTEQYNATEARKIAREYISLIHRGIDPKTNAKEMEHRNATLEELLNSLIKSKSGYSPTTARAYRNLMTTRLKAFKDKRISTINQFELEQWFNNGSDKPTATNRAMSVLTVVFKRAVALDIIKEVDNPIPKFRALIDPYPTKRRSAVLKGVMLEKFLTSFIKLGSTHTWKGEEDGGWQPNDDGLVIENQFQKANKKTINETARDYILFKLLIGCRSAELKMLKWTDIKGNSNGATFTLTETKTGVPLTLPCTKTLFNILDNRANKRDEDNPYVFQAQNKMSKSGHIQEVRRPLELICKDAGIETITPHELRRAFINCAEYQAKVYEKKDGVVHSERIPYQDIQSLINHKKSNTQEYSGNESQQRIKQLEAIGKYFSSCINSGDGLRYGNQFDAWFYLENPEDEAPLGYRTTEKNTIGKNFRESTLVKVVKDEKGKAFKNG